MAAGQEQILCIKRNALPEPWVQKKTVLPMAFSQFTDQCTSSGFAFVNRKEAEEDPKSKQIIPYILLQTADASQTAVYSRKGSEKRLHDLWSVGIGGHINPIDKLEAEADFSQILTSGMERELDEELIRRPPIDIPEFIGIISEDITPVGSVHLGAVFRIKTTAPETYIPGPELNRFTWMATANLTDLKMELWSTLSLELLNHCSDPRP